MWACGGVLVSVFCLFVCLRKLLGVLGILEMYSIIRFFLVFFLLNLSVNVFANQPVVRFRNKTVGILAEGGADVFIASGNVTIMGDFELKTLNETVNITEKVDVLASLQNDMGLRMLHLAQRNDMGVICNPEGTEYRERDFETGEFGVCVCKKGYTGDFCLPTTDAEFSTAVALSDDGSATTANIGETSFNEKFAACPIVKYVRNGVDYAYYARTSDIPSDFNAYSIFTYTWANTDNVLGTDFEIYSSLDDVKSGSNKWSFCNYNDPDVGFPRDCGPNGSIGNTWFSLPGDRFNARGLSSGSSFELYDGSDCPV